MHDRYDTERMAEVWSEANRNKIERQLWIDVMRNQQMAGVPIPDEAIEAYVLAADAIPQYGEIELKEIAKIEAETRHDLVARLRYFNMVAGYDHAHIGLTSADIVENTQQFQIQQAAEVLADSAEQVVIRLAHLVRNHADRPLVGRTHGRPAQLTTVGKRVADWVTELITAMASLDTAIEHYVLRGIKGAVGTRADLVALLDRHRQPGQSALEQAEQFDTEMFYTEIPGVGAVSISACGQTCPRGFDLPIVAGALQLAAACDTIATNIRLWAVLGHANEARDPGQIGSSAMPHKSNPRYSERVHSLTVVARGYGSMLQELAGAQWFEGDVSTSAARRIALPGLFHAVDSALANMAFALDRLQLDFEWIAQDVRQHLPHLASGVVLEACVAAGASRTEAHARISEITRLHGASRWGGNPLDWTLRLGADEQLPLTVDDIEKLVNAGRMAEPAAYVARQAAESLVAGFEGALPDPDPEWPGNLI